MSAPALARPVREKRKKRMEEKERVSQNHKGQSMG